MRREWTRTEIEQLVVLTLDGVELREIGRRLRRAGTTIRAMQIELELVDAASIRRRWTEAEKRIVREKYEGTPSIEIALELGRKVRCVCHEAARQGLKKSAAVIAGMARARLERGDHGSIRHRFKRGSVPPNKGKKSPGVAPGRMAETQFKKGGRSGKAAQHFMPLGSTRLIDGYLYRKVAAIPNVAYSLNWKPEHRLIWEKAHGPVPLGHVLVFKDGNRAHFELDNLELIPRAELARRNTIHNLPEPLKEVIRMNASLKRRIRKIDAQEQDARLEKPSLRDARSA